MVKLEDFCGEVAGLMPVYSNSGSICRIICRSPDDSHIYSLDESRTVEGVKRALARCYALDLNAQARILQKKYHRSTPLPFYFSDGRIFIPYKLRPSRIPGDSPYGYIELGIIERIVPGKESKCQLVLSDGEILPVFSQIATARLALFFGWEIQKNHFAQPPDPEKELVSAVRILHRYFFPDSLHFK